jgi:hypothetical protein
MSYFESLVRDAVRYRRSGMGVSEVALAVAHLYRDAATGKQVEAALRDPFFPLTLYARHHLPVGGRRRTVIGKAGEDLALLSRMFLRIRKDIDRHFGNHAVTCVDLNGDAGQKVAGGQWCSLCGECCQLAGTVPDPPEPIRYPGYWYAYIAGDSPLVQHFCPFLFELPSQGLFFCAIHHIKPLTCLAYGQEACEKRHPGMANVCG